jgi:hypothetical protein
MSFIMHMVDNAIEKNMPTIGPLIRKNVSLIAGGSALLGALAVSYGSWNPLIPAIIVGSGVYVYTSDDRIQTAIEGAVKNAKL